MFPCTDCERQLADQESFDQHRCAVHQFFYQCNFCAEEFHLLVSFKMHEKTVHPGQSPTQIQRSGPRQNGRLKCHECGENFASKPEMFTHKAREHKLKHPNCKICHLNLDSEMLLLEHMRAKHPLEDIPPTQSTSAPVLTTRQYRCVCGAEFRSESARQEHARTKGHNQEPLQIWETSTIASTNVSTNASTISVKQEKPISSQTPVQQIPNRCHECQAVFDNALAFNNHNKAVHYFQCNNCEAHFRNTLAMHEHQRKVHSFPCKCGQFFLDALTLARHQHEEHCLQCPKCDSKFEAFAQFMQHMEERHEFRCSSCLAVLHTPESLSMHYREFHSLVCTICQVGFDYTSTLLRHIALNHQFKCLRCPAVFEEAQGLELHHHVGAVIKCSRCKDEFIDGLLFAKHIETNHSFECAKCDSGFFQSSAALEQHEIAEHLISCSNCEQTFEDTASYLAHVRDGHPRSVVGREQKVVFRPSEVSLVSFLD